MRDGAQAEFQGAYALLFSRAYRVAYRLLGDRSEAEDVAQEALTRALVRWRRISSYAEPWVARVAANLAIDVVRRRRRAAELDVEHVVTDLHTDERVDLVRALQTLPRRQREVVVLRYVADLSEAEVARTLGCSNGTVKSHASRGLTAMRARLGEVI